MPDAVILDVRAFHRLCESQAGVRILDVRTAGEFESEHVPGAFNVPLDTLHQHAPDICATVSEPIVLMCRSGQRARKAAESLGALGMQNLYVMDGGMLALVASGMPVNRGKPRMSLERQVRIAAGGLAAAGGFLALFVHPYFAAIPAAVGSGLVVAALVDTCAMGMLLGKLPYNRGATCDVPLVVREMSRPQPTG